MQEYFEREVQTIKDLVADSDYDVEPEWPYMDWKKAAATFMQQAGVLFADAGRVRNPCTQNDIVLYIPYVKAIQYCTYL